jgi:hypothetical protein
MGLSAPFISKQRTMLLALSALMPGSCQQLSMFVLPHFFSSFFDDTSQQITSIRFNINKIFYTHR